MTTLAPLARTSFTPESARATIAAARITGATIGGMPLVDFTLVVVLRNGRVMTVESSMTVPCSELSRLDHGHSLAVRLDPDLPTSLRIDWRAGK